ncbi:MAG: type 1 glutamine amidotransferase domain-containing protein [Tissierellia bacterium]|nr:type 1 glutamine amidotransferase domain-containing protein [Tissierellia bacterium]
MKKVAVLLENMFDEQELIYPYHRLRENFEVYLIGTKKDQEYSSKAGVTFKADYSSKEALDMDFDGVFVPGGFSPDYMRRCDDTKTFIKQLHEKKKPIAAICHGPWLLCSALDLKGKNVTSFLSIKDDVEHAGGKWIDEEVVVDENLLTSRTPKDLPALMKAFLKQL